MAEVKLTNNSPINLNAIPDEPAGAAAPPPAGEVPPLKTPQDLANILKAKPELAAPLMAAGLALEVLMEALGAEERKTVVKTSTESLKSKAAQRKETNDKQLDEMKTRLEKMAAQKKLSGFLKVFKIIGLIVGVVAAAATLAAGVMTGNPFLIAGGVAVAALAVDSIVSAASDGKHGLAQWVTAFMKAMGVDEKTAQWIGLGFTIAVAVTGAALSLGGAASSSIKDVAQSAEKVARMVKVVTTTTQMANAANSIAEGSVGIAMAVNQYDVEKSRIRSKELEAILARLQEATEVEQEFLKTVMQKFEAMLSKVSELVKANNETQAAILGGNLRAPTGVA